MHVDTEQYLRRAAECILMAVESSDLNEQETMLNLAQSWLHRSANPAHLIERALDEARSRQF